MTRPRLISSLLGGLTVVALVLGAPLPAFAAGTGYVALGDSYSSGLGTGTYINDGTDCDRSVYSYPALDAARLGLTLNLRACAGATVADVRSTQLSALSSSTAYVSISVGGNDIGFASVLTTCAEPSWLGDCNAAVDGAVATMRTTLPAALASLYRDIRAKAPQAKVVVVGYPHLFNGVDCSLLTWFSSAEMTRLNAAADLLDATTATAAAAAGFTFVDPRAAFTGHAVCAGSPWLTNLTWPVAASFHPNRNGQSGYASLVAPALTGSSWSAPSAAKLQALAASITTQARAYAAADSRITAKTFVAPDLTTSAAKAAAAKAGVTVSDKASVDRADKAVEAQQVAARASAGKPVLSA